jgi:ABC-type phosphate transport system auxiliary subunit
MPVTAKLSRKFYETFGDQLTDELVDWFNQVDATYRADLRELNELNFSRFDAKLEQRAAELDAKWDRRFAQLDAKLDQRVAQLDAKLDQRVAELAGRLDAGLAALRADLIKWMFVFWAGTTLTVLGTTIALLKL